MHFDVCIFYSISYSLIAESVAMRKIKNRNLAQLLMQLRFTPEAKRQKQLDSVEKLLAIIDIDQEYPFEFVCFRITGFHPVGLEEQELIKGEELFDDLQIFIFKLSGQLARPAAEQSQKIYTVEELARVFDVSTKTVYRWRKRGLVALKYIFEDGLKRLGFLQSTVDRFLKANPELISRATSFTRLTDKQRKKVIRRAATLAARSKMFRKGIIDKIAAEIGKTSETVRYTIMNYEKANPDRVVFDKPSGVIDSARAAELYKLFKQGCDIKELMRRFGRSKSSIYRIINKRSARALLAEKIEFIDSEEFLEGDAQEKILKEPIISTKPVVRNSIDPFDLAGESLLPEYIQTLKDTPVLKREREVELFRRYNYLKFLACKTRTGMKPSSVSSALLHQIEDYLAEAETIKKMIIEANLRLVVSVASKHVSGRASLLDLVGEGNVSLMRAVEKFDYTKGFRFGTYASWAIAKGYARKMPARTARSRKAKAASLADIHRDLRTKDAADFAAIERARQSLAQVIRDELGDREQYIILNRFGPVGLPIKKKTKSLKQIGEDLGLTKERVRQIELLALQKLRQSLSAREFELLTG